MAPVGVAPLSVPVLAGRVTDDRRREFAALALARCRDGRANDALIELRVGDPRHPTVQRMPGQLRVPLTAEPLLDTTAARGAERRVAALGALDDLGLTPFLLASTGLLLQNRLGRLVSGLRSALAGRNPRPPGLASVAANRPWAQSWPARLTGHPEA
jgi:hypothetical protein